MASGILHRIKLAIEAIEDGLLVVLLVNMAPDASADEGKRALLIAQQSTESSPPRQDGSPGAGGTPDPPTRETTDGQNRKRESSIKPFRPSQQIPAGGGVSFPADI